MLDEIRKQEICENVDNNKKNRRSKLVNNQHGYQNVTTSSNRVHYKKLSHDKAVDSHRIITSSQQREERDMGPVYGVEHRRPEIWKDLLKIPPNEKYDKVIKVFK